MTEIIKINKKAAKKAAPIGIPLGKKYIFLDIDGVLNSYRTVAHTGGYPHTFEEKDRTKFDWTAIGLVRKAAIKSGAEVILSSSWRYFYKPEEAGDFFGIPIYRRTPWTLRGHRWRGSEIAEFLEENPCEKYCIIDDETDFLPEQEDFLVRTDEKNGLSYQDFEKILKILEVPQTEKGLW